MATIEASLSLDRDLHPVTNPATGETIAQIAYANAADVDRAAIAAHKAFLSWREVPVVDRVQPLYRFKALLEKHSAEMGRRWTTPKPK